MTRESAHVMGFISVEQKTDAADFCARSTCGCGLPLYAEGVSMVEARRRLNSEHFWHVADGGFRQESGRELSAVFAR